MRSEERQELAKNILIRLYNEGYVETVYNTQDREAQKKGWMLKSFAWSPWYFNIRPVGASPGIVSDIAYAMNHMIRDEVPGLTQIVGIEMAGVPLVSAVSLVGREGCELIPYSFTRAIPGRLKPRTPDAAKELLVEYRADFGYGGKELVEGRFVDGDVICIVDDMVTTFGSKLIAKYILEHELESREVTGVEANHVAVVLDREQGAAEEAKKQGMHLHALINFKTDGLPWLSDVMHPKEHELICDYQKNPRKYTENMDLYRKVLKEANEIREGR